MTRTMTSLAALCAAFMMSTGCSFEHSTSVLAPTEVTGGGASTPSPSPSSNPTTTMVGVWASNTSPAVPQPSTCNGFEFQVTSQTANSVTGSFTGKCGGGLVISGSGTGQLNGEAVTLNISGSASGAGLPNCPFTLTANGTVADEGYALPLSYNGTTCLGPVNGTTTLRRARPQAPPPPPAPAPAPAPAPPPPPPPPPGSEYHVGPGPISEDRAKQIVFATAEEFPHLTAVFGSEADAVAAAEQLLLRTIWHLKLAGFDAARQKNPSGAISNDKVSIHVNGGWHVYDIYSLGYAGRATTVIFFEVPLPNPQPNNGIADGQ